MTTRIEDFVPPHVWEPEPGTEMTIVYRQWMENMRAFQQHAVRVFSEIEAEARPKR